jgi:HTH-type transcriptional regulator, sugar sensing transcriptional regulator
MGGVLRQQKSANSPCVYFHGVSDAFTAAQRLARLGLTQYEARTYVALVRRETSSPAEVARLAGVPRSRIYDVIDSLVAKGMATERPGARAAKVVATPPAEAIDALVRSHHERLEMLEADAEAARDELGPAFSAGSAHSDPLDYVELIRSSEGVAKRFLELEQSVEEEMLVFAKMPAAVPIADNRAGLEVARTRDLRTVYEFSLLDDPDARAGVRRFIAAGELARFVEELPMKMGVIDERTVLFAMPDPVGGDSALTTLVIENVQLARCLKIVFEHFWAQGIGFTEACELRGVSARR